MSLSTYGRAIMVSCVRQTRRLIVHKIAFTWLLLTLCLVQLTSSLPLEQFYPFDPNTTANIYNDTIQLNTDYKTEKKDDGGSPLIKLFIDFPFFNNSNYRQLYVNNNGIISFEERLQTYKPMNFNDSELKNSIPLVAPFWADIDIENVVDSDLNEVVVYRISNESETLNNATSDVRKFFIDQYSFSSKLVITVTWYNVGYYGATNAGKQKRNTFQTVLTTNGERSFAIFNYNKTVWTTGANSQGSSETGLGGAPAVAGFTNGNESFFLLDNSGSDAIINITAGSNTGLAGQYIFRVDEANVNALLCSQIDRIEISPTTTSMLGHDLIRVTGPCLSPDLTIKARLRETNQIFSCDGLEDGSAVCVTPSSFRTGNLTFDLDPYGQGWNFSASISSDHLLSVPSRVSREDESMWSPGNRVKVAWGNDPDVPSDTRKTLEVLGYKKNSAGTPEFQQLTDNTFTVERGVFYRKFRLPSGITHSSLVIRLCWSSHPHTEPVCIWSDVFPVRWSSDNDRNSQESEGWCETWLREEQKLERIKIVKPNCPCLKTIAENDIGNFHADPYCDITRQSDKCKYNSNAQMCFRRNIKSPEDSGETCCYDNDGSLMDIREAAGSGSGTHQRYHYKAQGDDIVPFFSYFESDLLPRLHCCQYSSKNCSQFKTLRPATTCKDYKPPSPAQAAGDPHIVTLDGKNYSFNGVGDFYLVRNLDPSLVIQVRAVQATDEKGDLQNATVFSHLAIEMPGSSDRLEIRKSDTGSETLVNDRLLASSTSHFRNISLVYNNEGSHVIVLEPISVSVTVSVTPDMLNIIVLIGQESFKGYIDGLLGNYNGNPNDDFVSRNGTTLPSDSSMRLIHYDFGMTWKVPENESIISSSTSRTNDVNSYAPLFPDEISEADRNFTIALCGDNKACQFDYSVTGKESLARSTLESTNKFEALRKELTQTVIRCDFLEIPENGNRTVNGNSNGSIATFTCDPGYELTEGDAKRICQTDGWSGRGVECAVKTVDPDDKQSIPFVLIGALTGGGAFLVVVIVVIFFVVRHKRQKPKPDPSPDIPLDRIGDGPIFENQVFVQRLYSLFSDGIFRIPRPNYVDPNIFDEYF